MAIGRLVAFEIDERDDLCLRLGILRDFLRRQHRVAAVCGDERVRDGADAARAPPFGVRIRRDAERTGDIRGVAVTGLHEMVIEARREEEHGLARGRRDDVAGVRRDPRSARENAEIARFQVREEYVVALDL